MEPRDVLIAHQRTDDGCLCGVLTIGASHADHVIFELGVAGYVIVDMNVYEGMARHGSC